MYRLVRLIRANTFSDWQVYAGMINCLYGFFFCLPSSQHHPLMLYDACRQVMPLWIWGTIYLLAGVCALAGLASSSRYVLQVGGALGMGLWGFVGTIILLGDAHVPTGYGCLLMASWHLITILKANRLPAQLPTLPDPPITLPHLHKRS